MRPSAGAVSPIVAAGGDVAAIALVGAAVAIGGVAIGAVAVGGTVADGAASTAAPNKDRKPPPASRTR